MRYESLVAVLLVLLVPARATASDSLGDAWFDDDWEARVAQVNTGEVVFLASPPVEPVHHHHSRIMFTMPWC